MAYLMNLWRRASAGLPALLLAGCCANNVCDCPGEAQADAVRIVFDRPTFKDSTELDTLLLVRTLRRSPGARPETVLLTRTAAQAYDTLVINNTAPFGQFGSARLDTFSYAVRYFPGKKPKGRPSKVALYLDQVTLRGAYEGDGCCTCYTNSRKVALVRDSLRPARLLDLRRLPAVRVPLQ